MKLYRIKRISDGKFFTGCSTRTLEYLSKWESSTFGKTGVFYKGPEVIKKHLHNICHDWEVKSTGKMFWQYDLLTVGSPHWSRLDNYEVEIITIIDHGEKTQPAADFMGIKEKLLS